MLAAKRQEARFCPRSPRAINIALAIWGSVCLGGKRARGYVALLSRKIGELDSPSLAPVSTRQRHSAPHYLKMTALAGSIVLSAALTAMALRSPDYHWLAWISFLPLFVAVRWLGCPIPSRAGGRNHPASVRGVPHSSRSEGWGTGGSARHSRRVCRCSLSNVLIIPGGLPLAAVLAGALWGGCLYLFCTTGPAAAVDATAGITPSAGLLVLMIVIPAVYVGLAARPARAIGYKLLVLALGWILLEAVFQLNELNQHGSSGPHQGLLVDGQGAGSHVHWLARLLGYVCTAFVVACANASLLRIVSGARLSFPPCRSLAGSLNIIARLAAQVGLPIQSWTLRQAHPRAPPILIAMPN